MVDSINFVIACIVVIVILLIITSVVIFLYKMINNLRQEKTRQIFENYSKEVYEIITGKKNGIDAKNLYILSDAININYSWIAEEEKWFLNSALKNINFFDFAIKKVQRGNKAQKLRFAKVISIVGGEEELKALLRISIREPYLIDIMAEAIFKNIDKIENISIFKPYLKTIFLNLDKYPDAVRRRIEFFAVYGSEKIKDIIMQIVKEKDSEKVLISCLNVLSEIATLDDLENIDHLLEHPSAEVRATFCRVLEKTGCRHCEQKLKKFIENEKINFVKLRALKALSGISPKSSFKYLLSALEDEWFYMRDFARKMLSKFGPIVLNELLAFYRSTTDKFAKDKIIEVFYSPENFEYLIKCAFNYRTEQEKNLALEIIEILESTNPRCFYQRLKDEGYEYLITKEKGSE